MLLERFLEARASAAVQAALELAEPTSALLRPTQDPRFGDFQLNAAMALGKQLGRPPRELAEKIAEKLRGEEFVASAEVAGPGFVNLTLDDAFLAKLVTDGLGDAEHLGVTPVDAPEKVIIDYSGPNIAKQMHVGHLRSTILGDAIARALEFRGHQVIRDNHLGDWGTQYGLLIVGMREFGDAKALEADPIVELERVYKLASERAKNDEDFAEAARRELKKLQDGDPENRALWKRFVDVTRRTIDEIYAELGVRFDLYLGESAYHDALAGVVRTLEERGIAREDEGAKAVFWGEVEGEVPAKLRKQKEPFLVQKRDGAYLYSTTDIATVLYRRDELGVDRALYVVDHRQALHFEQVFAVARLLGVTMELVHVGFGTVLGADGKPLKTRDASGAALTLAVLLRQAKERAAERIREGMAEGRLKVEEHEIPSLAKAVGIGAVKYADLMNNRTTDYRFDLDRMVSFTGNAGPYLQYVHARSASIFRKAGIDEASAVGPIRVTAPEEAKLVRRLVRFGDAVEKVATLYLPHILCEHLYDLASEFNAFYQACKVLDAEDEATKQSRLALVAATARQMRVGLGLLGIEAPERM
ncbi:MAG: arginine--tRNA ligase [Myxococcales bacterium]|nr:arginine--tRNA ligase [Myxococcales bacterium]